MPIDYKDYHYAWKQISLSIRRDRAKERCEFCNAQNGKPHWKTGSRVILTVAHINQDKKDNRFFNLRALCQRCHLLIDLPYHVDKRKKNVGRNAHAPVEGR